MWCLNDKLYIIIPDIQQMPHLDGCTQEWRNYIAYPISIPLGCLWGLYPGALYKGKTLQVPYEGYAMEFPGKIKPWGFLVKLCIGVHMEGYTLGFPIRVLPWGSMVKLYTGVPSKGYTLQFPLKVIPWGSLVRALIP